MNNLSKITGSKLYIEFEVNDISNNNNNNNDNKRTYWGWGLVASAIGPIYENISTRIDLIDIIDSNINQENNDSQIIENNNLMNQKTIVLNLNSLTESELISIKNNGIQFEHKSLSVPFSQQLKILIKHICSITTKNIPIYGYVLEIIQSKDNSSSQLIHITENTPEISIQSDSVELFFYRNEIICQNPISEIQLISQTNIIENMKDSIISSPSTVSESWSCPSCTFLNSKAVIRCIMCGTNNPNKILSNEDENEGIIDTLENTPSTPNEYTIWMCQHCTFMNQTQTSRCEICHFNRIPELPRIGTAPELPLLPQNSRNSLTPPTTSISLPPQLPLPPPLQPLLNSLRPEIIRSQRLALSELQITDTNSDLEEEENENRASNIINNNNNINNTPPVPVTSITTNNSNIPLLPSSSSIATQNNNNNNNTPNSISNNYLSSPLRTINSTSEIMGTALGSTSSSSSSTTASPSIATINNHMRMNSSIRMSHPLYSLTESITNRVEDVSKNPSELLSTDAPTPQEISSSSTMSSSSSLLNIIPSNSIFINVQGIFSPAGKFETLLNQSILNNRCTPIELRYAMTKWTNEADDILLDCINQDIESEKIISQNPFQWLISAKNISHLTLTLSNFTLFDIQCRAMLLTTLNTYLKHFLPIIDISSKDPESIGYLIRKCNKYIFLSIKQPILQKCIESTMTSGSGLPAHLNLDNFKATLSKDKKEMNPHEANNCFVQAFHQLNKFDSKIYRYIFNNDRVFQINFEGESGIDAGGVFREGISRIVEDLFDIEHFSLMLLCPNGQHSVHLNIDKFLPNPQHSSYLSLQMMEFVGKLMGMSLRAKLALPFKFPSLIWKKLLNETVDDSDLRAIDAITWSLLETIKNCPNDGIINQELFQEKYNNLLKFTFTGSDGVERELFQNGKNKIVTFDTRIEYCNLVLEMRLNECDKQIQAIKKGLSSVIDIRVLYLFSWQQIEILISGNPVFDIEVWKLHTESSLNPRTLELFWKVIESLNPKEQEGFVRFAWGRSRLPPAKEFNVKMKLTSRGSEKLPVAHTCFFSIEIPDYKTEEEMRHGILTAIHFGASGVLIG